jgi:hypothetical protein
MSRVAQVSPSRSWLRGWRARVVFLLTFVVGALSPLKIEAREGEVELTESCDEDAEALAAARPQAQRRLHEPAPTFASRRVPRIIAPTHAEAPRPRWQRPWRVRVPDDDDEQALS